VPGPASTAEHVGPEFRDNGYPWFTPRIHLAPGRSKNEIDSGGSGDFSVALQIAGIPLVILACTEL
jgi:hypothetical protein